MFKLVNDSPIRPWIGGVHAPGLRRRHRDRVRGCYELIYVQQEVLWITEEDRAFGVEAGQTLLLWPDRRHFGHRDLSPGMWFYFLEFAVEARPRPGGEAVMLPQYGEPRDGRWLASLFEKYLAEQKAGTLTAQRAEALATCMLLEVAPDVEAAVNAAECQPLGSILAQRVLDHISAHLTSLDALSTADIAATLHCHPDYLGRAFRDATGRTVVEHIHRERVRLAQQLLKTTDDPVHAIAERCGWPDARYFRRVFKRYAGTTPQAFRKAPAGSNESDASQTP